MELDLAVQSFLDDVLARGLSPKTFSRYRADLSNLSRFLAQRAARDSATVQAPDLRAYFADLQTRPNERHRGQKLSPFTVDTVYRSSKTFFTWCEREGLVAANPMQRLKKVKTPKRRVPRLSERQVGQLLNALKCTQSPTRNFAVVSLLVDSGVRRGELVGLTLADLDLKEGSVRVIGKGDKERCVPLGRAALASLKAWLRVRPPSGWDRVFLNPDGSPFQADGVRSLLNRLRRRLGLARLYPHLLRHTFATLYLARVHDPKSLQQILGHSRASTTLDLYVEYEWSDLKKIHRVGSPVDSIMRKRRRRH